MRANHLTRFLSLPAIIGPLPYNIVDGQLIDAVPVMGDFNWIVSQVNANVPALVGNNTYVPAASVGGTGNAITLAPSPIITAYAEGQTFTFRAINFNTSAVTIQTSGLAPRAVRTASAAQLSGQELVAGGIYTVTDTGTYYELTNGAQGAQVLFTPTISFGGGTTGITYGNQEGHGWKVNNLFYFTAGIVLTNKGSDVGIMRIDGLPYPVDATWNDLSFAAFVENVTFVGYVLAFIDPTGGANTIPFVDYQSGGVPVPIDNTMCTNTSAFAVAGWYPVA